jgi:signal transduction histidine kinase
MFKTLRGRVIATYFVVVIISLLLASVFFLFFLSRYIQDRDRKELLGQVAAIAQDVRQLGLAAAAQPGIAQALPQGSVITSILNTEGQVLKAKLVLVGPTGTVLAESRGQPTVGSRTLELPKNITSETGPRISRRFFRLLGKDYLFATAPTRVQGSQAFLIAIKPVEAIKLVAAPLIGYVAIAGGIALALSMLLALYFSGALSRHIREVTVAAQKIAEGDYTAAVPVRGSDEMSDLARDFNAMAERVRTAYELQRNFVGNVSHELRTPLTSIEGFSQALLDGVSRSEEERLRSLEIINQESKRMVRVLRDLLLLSEIDAGDLRPEKRQVDLTDLIRRLESLYVQRAKRESVTLLVEAPGQPVSIFTDPDRLERILTNLLDNAVKYTGAEGTVSLSASVEESNVRISVADTGPGIPPDVLPDIFDRFYRVEKSRSQKTGGSGLGLSISKELVWTLGGAIKVQSLLGQGTTFTVTLPIS